MANRLFCGQCEHVHKVIDPRNLKGVYECRRFPPQLITVGGASATGITFAAAVAFPNVDPDKTFCGELAAGIE